MQIQKFNTKEKVFIVAEIGNNHEGNFSLAEEMIGLAAESGADAVKFQTMIPEKVVSIQQTERILQLKRFQLSYDEYVKLFKVASNEGVIFLSTPFDIESAIFLNDFVPAFKIASGDNDFYPLIEVIAETGKPIIMSTGITKLDETEKSVSLIKNIWKKNHIKEEVALLHCVSMYPTPPENANLLAINELKKMSDIVGYSDHTSGIEAAILSVAFGARIIEKHFTIDNNYSDFHDHQLSLNPSEFKKMVNQVRATEKMLGNGKKSSTDLEFQSSKTIRRSIVASQNLPIGHKIVLKDLGWVRPGGGLKPGEEHRIIGKRLNQEIQKGEKILYRETMIDSDFYLRKLREDSFVIFLFHGVIKDGNTGIRNYLRKHLLAEEFEILIKKLKEKGNPISMDDVIRHNDIGKELPPYSYVITFDDGFENNYSVAAPILEKYSTPATFYVSTNLVDKNLMTWIDQVEYCFENTDQASVKLPWSNKDFQLNSNESKIDCLKDIRIQVKKDPSNFDLEKLVQNIFKQCRVNMVSSGNHSLDRKMNWAQVSELHSNKLFNVGCHTHNHSSLGFLENKDMKNEIVTSVNFLKNKAGISSHHYSYPEGQENDFNENVIAELEKNDIRCCPTAIEGLNNLTVGSMFKLKRVMVN